MTAGIRHLSLPGKGGPLEAIRILVQNIVIIVILALFLEMFLPIGDLKKYVKMVMGLLIIIAVIQAVGTMTRCDLSDGLSAFITEDDKTRVSSIIDAGKKMSGDQQQKAIEQFETGIARQIMALTGIYQDTPVVDVAVKVQSRCGEPDFGQINEIILYVTQTAGGTSGENGIAVDEVKPITITVNGADEKRPEREAGGGPPRGTVSGLIGTVADFYSLGQQQVKVMYR